MAKWKEFHIMKDQPTYDPVEKPAHYNQGNIECIDYIRQVLGLDGFIAYCKGSIIIEHPIKETLLKIQKKQGGILIK